MNKQTGGTSPVYLVLLFLWFISFLSFIEPNKPENLEKPNKPNLGGQGSDCPGYSPLGSLWQTCVWYSDEFVLNHGYDPIPRVSFRADDGPTGSFL